MSLRAFAIFILTLLFIGFLVGKAMGQEKETRVGDIIYHQDLTCDTEAQVTEIIEAFKVSPEHGRLVYFRFNRERNLNNEPVCGRMDALVFVMEIRKVHMFLGRPVTLFKLKDGENMEYFGITTIPILEARKLGHEA